MKNTNAHCIYALIEGQKAFVGKITSDDTKPILWRHLRGNNKYTQKHFKRGISEDLRYYTLGQVGTDFSEGYGGLYGMVQE